MSMKYETASVVGIIEDFATVLCFLADIFVFHVTFSFWGIIGTIMIVFVCTWISVSK